MTALNLSRLLTAFFTVMVAVPLAATMAVTPAAAQTGPEIIQQMLDRHRERLSDIRTLLIEQEVLGMSTELYLVKEMIDGEPTLVPRTTVLGGTNVPMPGAAVFDAWSGSAQVYGQWADRFSLDGSDEVDGRPVYRLTIDDFSDIDLGAPPGQDMPMTPRRGVFYVDQSDLVVLRMEMEMDATTPGGSRVVTLTSTLDDYREVDGYLHPFRTAISVGELMSVALGGLDRAEIERQLEELELRLDEVPPGQRAILENMLQPLRDMLAGAPLEIIVTRIEANVDPPTGR